MMQNPVYIGTNGSGTYVYVGQWEMPPLRLSKNEIKKITLHIYRNANSSAYSRNEYIGCSGNQSDYASVLSTGIKISLSANKGWKVIDVTGLAEYITEYSSTWYLLIGNPNGKNSYVEIAGYGSGNMLYLEIELSNGSKIYLSTNGELTPYQLYRSENGTLVKYDLYHSENGSLVRY
jgi:hypothetical protein